MKVLASLLWLLLLLSLPRAAQATALIGDARVVDGDTLAFDGFGVTVRLDGIDAPESRQACESAEGDRYECGMAATQALKEKMVGKPVRCEGDQRDRYGRLLATCFTSDGADLNGWLVEQGHALAYRHYSEQYVLQEEMAREGKRGLWAGRFVKPWDWRRGERLEAKAYDDVSGVVEAESAGDVGEVDALALYDDNGNGRITCKEARTHGIAPVSRGHPAYQYMRDADNDGVVCE